MKKFTALFLAAAMMLVAAPVFAAPQLNLSGTMTQEVGYDFEAKKTVSEMDLDLRLDVVLNSGQNIRGMIVFKPLDWEETVSMGKMTSVESTVFDFVDALRIKEAYIETEGAFWEGGQSIITRLGDLSLNYSPYILESETGKKYTNLVEGISISGITVGPLTADAFYGWYDKVATYGTKLATNFLGLQLETAFVRYGQDELDYTGKMVYSPNEKVILTGEYAANTDLENRDNNRDLARVGANIVLPYGLNLSAAYRNTDLGYDAMFRNVRSSSPLYGEYGVEAIEASIDKAITENIDVTLKGMLESVDTLAMMNPGVKEDGYYIENNKTREIGISTNVRQNMADLRAGYKLSYNVGAEEFTHTTNFGVGVADYSIANVVDITASYDVTLTNLEVRDMRHEVAVALTSNALEGITVSGRYDTQPGVDDGGDALPKVEAKINYDAPNGINLGYTYQTFESQPAVSKVFAGIGVEF